MGPGQSGIVERGRVPGDEPGDLGDLGGQGFTTAHLAPDRHNEDPSPKPSADLGVRARHLGQRRLPESTGSPQRSRDADRPACPPAQRLDHIEGLRARDHPLRYGRRHRYRRPGRGPPARQPLEQEAQQRPHQGEQRSRDPGMRPQHIQRPRPTLLRGSLVGCQAQQRDHHGARHGQGEQPRCPQRHRSQPHPRCRPSVKGTTWPTQEFPVGHTATPRACLLDPLVG